MFGFNVCFSVCFQDGLHINDVCRGQLDDELRQEYDTGGKYAGGGGGGGGATFIAKVNNMQKEMTKNGIQNARWQKSNKDIAYHLSLTLGTLCFSSVVSSV